MLFHITPDNQPGILRSDHKAKPEKSDKTFRFVATADSFYLPGFIALIQSLKEKSAINFKFAVIDYGLSKEDRDKLERTGVEFDWFIRQELGGEIISPSQSLEPRMFPNLWKPLMWLLPYDETLMYIDTDVLCLNSLVGIHSLPSISVVVNQSDMGEPLPTDPDTNPNYLPSGFFPFNAGIMVYKPDPDVYYGMLEYAKTTYVGKTIRYGDQIVQNDFISQCRPDLLHYIDVNWNFSVLLTHQRQDLYHPDKVKLLHWAQETKPWIHDPPGDWQDYFWDLWAGFYQRAQL